MQERLLTIEQARRFLLRKQGLLGDWRFAGKEGALAYVRQAGCIQFDPVDVCGKNAELTLQSRVKGFQKAGTDREAHHVLPVAHETQFRSAGIENIHSPIYGAWVDPTAHRKWSYEYNQRWDTFFRTTTNPTVDQILDYADELAEEFGFEVYYNG